MSQTLTVQLSDRTFAEIQQQAEIIGISPEHLVAILLEQNSPNVLQELQSESLVKNESEIEGTNIEEQFFELVNRWKMETAGSSLVSEKIKHSAYQKIIDMGEEIVPLLLTELEKNPSHWFTVLQTITGENPIQHQNRGRIKKMAEDWLRWGCEKGYIKSSKIC